MIATMNFETGSWRRAALAAAAVLAALLVLPAAGQSGYDQNGYGSSGESQVGYDSGYSYLRNLRGAATLVEGDSGDRQEATVNLPVLAGDRLWVAAGSMAEVLLSDGNLLRVDGDSEVLFARLAASPETDDEVTELVLVEGNLQLVVFADAAGREVPRVELPNGTAYLEEAGAYRLTAGRGWSQVVARSGWAEVATDRGSVVVRGGEEAVIDGSRGARADVRTASIRDDLERWGERLDHQVADRGEVDRSLAYEAAALDGYGSWIDDGDRRVWRPRVADDWQPYRSGYWRHTPLGLTWVSSEPWGWAPYHYGTWNLHPRHGWVWYPGTAFAPAWVYWYWGPSHVAWVPVGYYTHHYRSRYHYPGFRFGVYGWAGGHWGIFNDWVFCPTGSFGRPWGHRDHWRGRDWNHHNRGDQVPRGIIAIDTRPLSPTDLRDGESAMRALRSRPITTGAGGGELPDVTSFIARERELPADVERRVFVDPEAGVRTRVAGTPLAPDAASAARPRVGPRVGTPLADGGAEGAGSGDLAPRARVTPRVPVTGAPGDAPAAAGAVRPRRVISSNPSQDGAAGDGESPAAGVRPRRIEPRNDDAGATGGSSGPEVRRPAVRPRRIEPREPAGGSGGSPAGTVSPRRVAPQGPEGSDRSGVSASPRRVVPQRPEGTDRSGVVTSPRRVEPSSPGAVRPRAVTPRQPAGDPDRPAAQGESRPRVRSSTDDADQGMVRSSAPRGVTPDAYARSPRSLASSDRPSVVVPPRSERSGVRAAPPARRVVTGVRSSAPSSPSRPSAVRPSAPRRTPAASSPSSRSGSSRSVRPRSDDRPSSSQPRASSRSGSSSRSSRASASSGSSSRSSSDGGRARATRRSGDDN